MEQKFEIQNNSRSKKLSIFYKQTPTEYDSSINEINEEQNEKVRFYYRFQISNSQPQKFHEGDQDISCNSFKAEINDFLQKSQMNVNTTNQSICKTLQEEVVEMSLQDYLMHQPKNIQSQQESNQNDAIKTNINVNDNSLSSDFQDAKIILEQGSSTKRKIINDNSLNRNDEVQSNYFQSKNTIIKSETKKQHSQIASEHKSIIQSNQNINNNHILIQDDIFYEKDLRKLGTKVNFALQSQYQFQQDFKAATIYKQNLQKAAKIVSRLLNSSMNRVMRIRQYANNFIILLKLRHQNRKIEGLSNQEFLIINDLSHFHLNKSKIHQSQKFLRFLFVILKFAKFFPTFMPSNSIRVIWDVILVGFTYVFLYVYSLIIFFDQNYFDTEFLQKFNFTIFTLFLVDILVNLNTAFYEKDIIITKRMLIAKKYFFSSIFITDCVSMFMLGYKIIYSNKSVIYDLKQSVFTFGLNSLIFLKANGISSKKKRFDYVFTLTENQKHICKLINQLATVITVAHLAAIGWYFVGVQEANNNQANWLEKIGIQSNSIYQLYIYAIYWSITTMTTVGYGDISATNSVEALYISITMILFSCVFAYSINNIGFILQEIEKSSKQLNDDLSTIQRQNFKKIQDTIDCLKQNLEFDNGESFFFFDENLLSSNETMSQYENDEDEDEDSQSDIPSNSLEKDQNQKKSIKGSVKERIDKSSKNILKSQKSYQTSNDGTEQQFNQDNQIQKCHSNLVYESQDIPKTILNIVESQSRIKSSQTLDSIDSNNQEESSKNNFSRQKSQQESNVVPCKKGRYSVQRTKSAIQQKTIYQKEIEGSDQNNSKILEQQRTCKNSINSTNIELEDLKKKLLRQRSKKSSHKISSQHKEDQFQQYHQENSQAQQSFKSESNKKTSIIYHSSQSHRNSFQKSLKLLNQSQKEPRYSVDQQIQNIAALMLLQNKNISSQQINNVIYNQSYQQYSSKSDSSKLSLKDNKEQSQISKKSNRLSYNKENSQNNLLTQQSIRKNKKQISSNELIIDRLSKILQNSQIPLLLQLTTGKSFQHLDSQFLGNPMDQFDKMQCFKKFYPDYNFDKVLQKLKSSKQEQKRLKKIKLATKERRQNIGFNKLSVFQANSNLFKLIPQEYDINLYKPTYLSYGTRMKKGNIYPINNFYQQNN